MRIALAQINTTVGDLDGNVERILVAAKDAAGAGADLVVYPELAITGYPPEDLLFRSAFVTDNLEALADLSRRWDQGPALLIGFVDRSERGLHNAAAVVWSGEVIARYHKHKLPNYGVFDEARYFVPGDAPCSLRLADSSIGISICEDAWRSGPPFDAYAGKVRVVPNLNASPYHRGKAEDRVQICRARARETGAWIVYVNAVGGQDELVFDGGSLVVDPGGDVAWRANVFEEDLLVVDVLGPGEDKPPLPATERAAWPGPVEEVYRALVLGLRDYVLKNGFSEVAIGLSGGIDSSLVAVLAADALGAASVRGLSMPSAYSSEGSLTDADELARRLGIRIDRIPIEEIVRAHLDALAEVFAGTEPNVAEENLQARARGNLLMAVSNKFGALVLPTGNNSEMATGNTTLYGDLAGGFAPNKDVPKTLVFELARWRNAQGPGEGPIPRAVIDKPPSAELRPGQLDTDSLPPYDVLDPILEGYIEGERSPEDLVAEGQDADLVARVVRLVDGSEYKRRQAPPGVKITPKAFGRDRRLPITNGYRRDLRNR
ncbi:MAG: NAD+ synthase [Actinomycetota bacterium]